MTRRTFGSSSTTSTRQRSNVDRSSQAARIGLLAFVVVYALQVIVAPVPGLPIGAAAGFVFGLVPAMLYGTVGLAVGVVVALFAGRVWGLRLLARVAGPDAIARWERLRLV